MGFLLAYDITHKLKILKITQQKHNLRDPDLREIYVVQIAVTDRFNSIKPGFKEPMCKKARICESELSKNIEFLLSF